MFLSAAGNLIVPQLEKGKVYRLRCWDRDKTCTTTFVPDGMRDKPHFKGPDNDQCMPSSGVARSPLTSDGTAVRWLPNHYLSILPRPTEEEDEDDYSALMRAS